MAEWKVTLPGDGALDGKAGEVRVGSGPERSGAGMVSVPLLGPGMPPASGEVQLAAGPGQDQRRSLPAGRAAETQGRFLLGDV